MNRGSAKLRRSGCNRAHACCRSFQMFDVRWFSDSAVWFHRCSLDGQQGGQFHDGSQSPQRTKDGYAAGLRAFVSVRQAKLNGAVLFARRQVPGGILSARQREGHAARQHQQRSIPLVGLPYEVVVKTVHRRTSNPPDEEPGPGRHHSILP